MEHPFDRRMLLKVAAAAGAGAVGTPTLARAANGRRVHRVVFKGEFTDPTTPDWVYLPFRVPEHTRRIHVSYDYTPTTGGPITTNVVDIGIFDASGHELGNAAGFRGWSGGARREFSLSRHHATPGYLAGPLTPGRWVIALGPYQINGRGTPYKVVVECVIGPRKPRPEWHVAPQAVPGTAPGWYRGDLHTHTVYSDGRWTQPTLLSAARAAGLDFIGTSEHNTSAATYTWGRHVPDDYLVVNGEEVTTRNGHWLATGLPPKTWIDWRYRAADDKIQAFAEQVRELGGVTVAAHPSIPVPSIKWDFDPDFAEMDAVEVWNGPWTYFNQQALLRWDGLLKRGIYKPGVGNSDSHHDGQQVGLAHNVMRMGSLSAAEMVAAVKGGHLWITGSSGVDLTFSAALAARSATCGETLAAAAPGDTVTVTLTATGVPSSVAQLWGPSGVLAGAVADGAGAVTLTADLPASALAYVRAEIRRPKTAIGDPTADYSASEMVALTNPVFVTTSS
jgi:predicted metal-dependent phosphoesterase TrpH